VTTTTGVLQTALAAEHAAVYAYGAAGGRLAARFGFAARTGLTAHRAARDALAAAVRARGGQPVDALAAYALDPPPVSIPTAARLLVATERTTEAAYAGLLAATDDAGLRRLAVNALADSAARATGWRVRIGAQPATEPFPGLAAPRH
jgi:hypothetical protein